MYQGKTSFSRISGMVNRDNEHRITARVNKVQEKRNARLKKLGVRPLTERGVMPGEIPTDQQKFYQAAYEALKNSDKSWASDDEIKSILFGDKEMTNARSEEVIEIMRKAGVPGFKETDEVTSGDVYSERVMDAIALQEKTKKREAEREHLNTLRDKDKKFAGDMDIDHDSHSDEAIPAYRGTPLISREINDGDYTYAHRKPVEKDIDLDPYATNTESRPTTAQKKTPIVKKEEKKDQPTSVPLTDVLDDMDM